MSRSAFFPRSSRDSSPLLLHDTTDLDTDADAVSLRNLSPRASHSRVASPSPPPSFYRASSQAHSVSPSPSRTKGRKIQFAAPPPPITTSVRLPAAQHATYQAHTRRSLRGSFDGVGGRSASPRLGRGGGAVDPLLGLERRERAIQSDLQLLLDAQAAGLVQGFGGSGEANGGEGGSDAGSSTPTSRSLQSAGRGQSGGGFVPVRQPKRRVVGLRGARRGLLKDMGELVAVKMEQVHILKGEIERSGEVVRRIEGWERKMEEVRGQLSGEGGSGEQEEAVAGSEEAQEMTELRLEEVAVGNEIREMEDRLAQMKARKRWLGDRIKESVNRREARLSSYRGALREVESEVREFLRRPPIPVSVVMGDEEGFPQLPASRRTLEMAKEWWRTEVSQLHAHQEKVETEKAALEEGARMWEESVKAIVDFEDELRTQMASHEVQDPALLRKQIGQMEEVVRSLSGTVRVAEERGWNLLICAVGAELEAFREGVEILKGALGVAAPADPKLADELGNGTGEEMELLERRESLSSEDDGPNLAELLVDRGDA